MTNSLYVIDIDGTIADCQHRIHLIRDANGNEKPKTEWGPLFAPEQIAADTPIGPAFRHFSSFGEFNHGPHVFLTSRPESCRVATMDWLVKHKFAPPVPGVRRLVMKPNCVRLMRAMVFKPAALEVLQSEYPEYQLVLIEDYDRVLEAVDLMGSVRTLKAPECWTDGSFV